MHQEPAVNYECFCNCFKMPSDAVHGSGLEILSLVNE